jgi:hypothetical protein
MSKNSKAQQAQEKALEKGFLYLSIAKEFVSLVADDLRQDRSIIRGMSCERRGGLMDSVACLMEDADDLLYQGMGYDHQS